MILYALLISVVGLSGCAPGVKTVAPHAQSRLAVPPIVGETEEDRSIEEGFAEKPIRLTGMARVQDFPGAPNYESIANGDELERYWVLTVGVAGKSEDYQLALEENANASRSLLKESVGKQIVIEGLIWQAHSGHHHTPFLITVRSIAVQSATGDNPKPQSP